MITWHQCDHKKKQKYKFCLLLSIKIVIHLIIKTQHLKNILRENSWTSKNTHEQDLEVLWLPEKSFQISQKKNITSFDNNAILSSGTQFSVEKRALKLGTPRFTSQFQGFQEGDFGQSLSQSGF